MTVKLGVIALAGPDNGGTYQYTLSTLQALRHTSFDITVYGDPENPDFAASGFPIVRFAESRTQQLGALAAHRLRIRLPDPFAAEDVLLAPIYAFTLLHTSKPFVFTLHDLQERYYPDHFVWWQLAARNQIYRGLLGRASRVICESRHVQSDIVRFFGTPEERTTVLPAPPQPQFLSALSAERLAAARTRLRLPDEFLFYPAQFWVHKNHLRLIEAFSGVSRELPDLHLVLTGKQRDDYAAVMEAIGRFYLGKRVLHLGYIEQQDLQAVYQLASALVMPSLFESVSIPIYEAFWMGTPVVASNILGVPEQVGDAGVLFDPTSVPSIRDAILKTLRDGEGTRKRAQRGREKMLSMTPERYGDQLQRLLGELAPGRTAGQNASGISGKPS